jgi:hypothetical protein
MVVPANIPTPDPAVLQFLDDFYHRRGNVKLVGVVDLIPFVHFNSHATTSWSKQLLVFEVMERQKQQDVQITPLEEDEKPI